MTFSARSRTPARALFAPFALGVLLVALTTAGCEDKHIGRLCDLNADAGAGMGTGTTATINPEALECPSRICILPPQQSAATDTTSLCTADCSSDDDCSDGETGPKGNTSDHHCETGFVCAIATTVGDFCCRRFCLCKDFTGPTPQGGFPVPKVCQAGNGSTCKNVPP